MICKIIFVVALAAIFGPYIESFDITEIYNAIVTLGLTGILITIAAIFIILNEMKILTIQRNAMAYMPK